MIAVFSADEPSHPLALAEQLPWEHLPLRQQPIWRVRSITASPQPGLARQPSRPKWRRPRLLLLIGPSQGLDLKPQIQALNTLKRAGRLELVTLGDQPNSADAALKKLRGDPQGWDGVIYLGHGDPSPAGGGGLKLEAGGLQGEVVDTPHGDGALINSSLEQVLAYLDDPANSDVFVEVARYQRAGE